MYIRTFLEWMIVFDDSTLWGMGLIEISYFFILLIKKKKPLPNGLLECLSEISFYCHMLVLCDRFFWKYTTDTPMYPRYETQGFQKNNHNKILLAEPMIFLRVACKCVGKRLLTGPGMTQMQLYHHKANPDTGEDSQKLPAWSSLCDFRQLSRWETSLISSPCQSLLISYVGRFNHMGRNFGF